MNPFILKNPNEEVEKPNDSHTSRNTNPKKWSLTPNTVFKTSNQKNNNLSTSQKSWAIVLVQAGIKNKSLRRSSKRNNKNFKKNKKSLPTKASNSPQLKKPIP